MCVLDVCRCVTDVRVDVPTYSMYTVHPLQPSCIHPCIGSCTGRYVRSQHRCTYAHNTGVRTLTTQVYVHSQHRGTYTHNTGVRTLTTQVYVHSQHRCTYTHNTGVRTLTTQVYVHSQHRHTICVKFINHHFRQMLMSIFCL